jgi:hypothetical protein
VHAAAAPSSTEILAATIAGAVERQLTQYISTMSQQVETVRQAADAGRAEMRTEFALQLEALTAKVEANHQANDRYQAALQAALEEIRRSRRSTASWPVSRPWCKPSCRRSSHR